MGIKGVRSCEQSQCREGALQLTGRFEDAEEESNLSRGRFDNKTFRRALESDRSRSCKARHGREQRGHLWKPLGCQAPEVGLTLPGSG